MDKRDTFLIELQTTFDAYVRWASSEVTMYNRYASEPSDEDRPTKRDKYLRATRNPHLEELLVMSSIENGDLANIEKTIKRTADWLKNYEYNYALSNISTIRDIRRAIEQMHSIYKISFAYPDNAIKRTIQLRVDINKNK